MSYGYGPDPSDMVPPASPTNYSSPTPQPSPPGNFTYNSSTTSSINDTYNSSTTPSANITFNSSIHSPSGMSSRAIAITTTTLVVGVVLLLAIAFLVFKYLQKKRQSGEGKIASQNMRSGEGKITMQNMQSDGGEGKITMQQNMQSDGGEGKITMQNMPSGEAEVKVTLVDSTKSKDSLKTEKFLEEISNDKPRAFTPEELKAFTNNYVDKLGSGGFGEVFKGRLSNNGVPIAVKVLKEISGKIVNDQFAAELGTVGTTNHINLVRLYGFCFHDEVKALVYEYMENGSLQACLDQKHSMLDWATLYKIALGTATGIRYLHEECKHKIIHYDIKPANVLLSKDFTPKVADFGMAELWDRESTLLKVTQGRGTPGFIAPELVVPLSATHKCDVYSFGMLLFEILGSRVKMEGKLDDCSSEASAIWAKEKAEKGELDSILLSCVIQEKDKAKAKIMCKVALLCVQYRPDARPSMISVVRLLEGIPEIGVPGSAANRVLSTGAEVKPEQS